FVRRHRIGQFSTKHPSSGVNGISSAPHRHFLIVASGLEALEPLLCRPPPSTNQERRESTSLLSPDTASLHFRRAATRRDLRTGARPRRAHGSCDRGARHRLHAHPALRGGRVRRAVLPVRTDLPALLLARPPERVL